MAPYTPPALKLSAFNCPHCNAFADQRWQSSMINIGSSYRPLDGFMISMCMHCKNPSYWFKEQMIYPNKTIAPLPNPDLPDHIKADFEEARQIANLSPKGAAALLRLVIQKLCVHLKEPVKVAGKFDRL